MFIPAKTDDMKDRAMDRCLDESCARRRRLLKGFVSIEIAPALRIASE